MNNVYKSKDFCCGCTACVAICPKHAIEMQSDEKGFFYPVIDTSKCNNCGLCRKSCAFSTLQIEKSQSDYYVGTHKDTQIYQNSQSGGAFTAISDIILDKNGIIYAVQLDNNFITRHVRVETKAQRNACSRSKYVQSNLINQNNESIFLNVMYDLQAGQIVLFCGTGCQCAALKHYLKIKKVNLNNLYILDIICNGVGSPLAVKKYLEWVSNKYNEKIKLFDFRDVSKFPYGTCVEKITLDSGKTIYQDYYANLYYHHIIRESCYNCRYTSCNRCTDITIGDAWGIEKSHPEMKGIYGCSVMLFHTDKAKKLIELLKEKMNILKVEQSDIIQPRLLEPGKKPNDFKDFWDDFVNYDFNDVINKWGENQYSKKNIFLRHCKKAIRTPFQMIKVFYNKKSHN